MGVDNLVLIDRLEGGFLGIGTSATKPGIVILSTVPRERADIRIDTGGSLLRMTLLIRPRRPSRETHADAGLRRSDRREPTDRV